MFLWRFFTFLNRFFTRFKHFFKLRKSLSKRLNTFKKMYAKIRQFVSTCGEYYREFGVLLFIFFVYFKTVLFTVRFSSLDRCLGLRPFAFSDFIHGRDSKFVFLVFLETFYSVFIVWNSLTEPIVNRKNNNYKGCDFIVHHQNSLYLVTVSIYRCPSPFSPVNKRLPECHRHFWA